MALVKPQLRGLSASYTYKVLFGMTVFSMSIATWWKCIHTPKTKQAYIDFYKTYDADKAFKVMRNAGLLQSVGPE